MTAEDLLNYPDADIRKHAELVRGVMEIREPSGIDASVIGMYIGATLFIHVMEHKLGKVTGENGGYTLFRNPDTVRGPDVAFVSRERFPRSGSVSGFFEGVPDLAVEVTSPSNKRKKDLPAKIEEYLKAGARLVWVFDLWARTVAIYRPGVPRQIIADGGVLDGEDVVPGFRLDVSRVWEVIASDDRSDPPPVSIIPHHQVP